MPLHLLFAALWSGGKDITSKARGMRSGKESSFNVLPGMCWPKAECYSDHLPISKQPFIAVIL
ncbi:hypothetical protein SY86_17155 [Erwinia tracheiphila]|uniref:Uncharacterized protein n=1 Tax=Erwinia tracheiphila TaxID=65700 RepID=A0A0M2KHM6_9GAMM|nr:hypothetical protein SY86_17155 [Erwinia tracheiphila]